MWPRVRTGCQVSGDYRASYVSCNETSDFLFLSCLLWILSCCVRLGLSPRDSTSHVSTSNMLAFYKHDSLHIEGTTKPHTVFSGVSDTRRHTIAWPAFEPASFHYSKISRWLLD